MRPAPALLCREAPVGRILSQPLKPAQVERAALSPTVGDENNRGSEEPARGPEAGQGLGTFLGLLLRIRPAPKAGLGCRGSTWRCWVNPSEGPRTALRCGEMWVLTAHGALGS